jgi:hypothetical protein
VPNIDQTTHGSTATERRGPAGVLDYCDLTEEVSRAQCAHRRVAVAYLRRPLDEEVEGVTVHALADDDAACRDVFDLHQRREHGQLLGAQRGE